MNLPTRIVREVPAEPVVSVDGAFGAPGLNLSHWPGNTTPREFRHDLSTGSALAFARLSAEERERWCPGASAIVNNHFDTDGLCAVFATRYPSVALEHAPVLLEAARAGDFFEMPSTRGFVIDAIVSAAGDAARSPWRTEIAGLGNLERWNLLQERLLERLPALLRGETQDLRELWEPELERATGDLASLKAAERAERDELDLTVWQAARPPRDGLFDPGRHALFQESPRDRALVLGSQRDGTSARFVISTRSWFDLVSRSPSRRPDLDGLAARLNELEGCTAEDELAWRNQAIDNASPELWFGRAELESFSEHNVGRGPSRLAPRVIVTEVERALGQVSRD